MGPDPTVTQVRTSDEESAVERTLGEALEFRPEPDNHELELTRPVGGGELESQSPDHGVASGTSPWTTRDPRASRFTMTVSSAPRPAVTSSGAGDLSARRRRAEAERLNSKERSTSSEFPSSPANM